MKSNSALSLRPLMSDIRAATLSMKQTTLADRKRAQGKRTAHATLLRAPTELSSPDASSIVRTLVRRHQRRHQDGRRSETRTKSLLVPVLNGIAMHRLLLSFEEMLKDQATPDVEAEPEGERQQAQTSRSGDFEGRSDRHELLVQRHFDLIQERGTPV